MLKDPLTIVFNVGGRETGVVGLPCRAKGEEKKGRAGKEQKKHKTEVGGKKEENESGSRII